MGSILFLSLIAAVFGFAGVYLTWMVWRDISSGQTTVREKGEPQQTYYREHTPFKFWIIIGLYVLSIALCLLTAYVFLRFLLA